MLKALLKVHVNNTHHSLLIHRVCHLIAEGSRVGQARFALVESKLVAPKHFLILCIPGKGFQEDFPHNLLRD